MSQAAFPIGWASTCILGQFEAGVKIVKALSFAMRAGLRASLVRPHICTFCSVGISAQSSCESCHLGYKVGVGWH